MCWRWADGLLYREHGLGCRDGAHGGPVHGVGIFASFVVVGILLYGGSCRGLLQCRRGLRPLQGCIA